MAYLNRIEIIGNLCGNVEQKQNSNGKAYSYIRVAVTTKYGETNKTYYYNCSIYRSVNGLFNYLTKGSMVYLNGELSTQIYNAQDGSPQIAHNVMVDNIQLLTYKDPAQAPQQSYAPQPGYAQQAHAPMPQQNSTFNTIQPPRPQQPEFATNGLPFPPSGL